MAFQLSPGVNVSEIDLTTVVPSVSTTAGAIVGDFAWGPANQRILVDSEITLADRFGKPDGNNYVSFFSAANFLAYGNNLRVVRAVSPNTNTAVSFANILTFSTNGSYVQGELIYQTEANTTVVTPNSSNTSAIGVVLSYANTVSSNVIYYMPVSGSFATGRRTHGFTSAANVATLSVSTANTLVDPIHIENEEEYELNFPVGTKKGQYFYARYVGDLGNNLRVSVCANTSAFATWQYKGFFKSAPGTSIYADSVGGTNDELHVIVIDATGKITGLANTVLEIYESVSKASDAKLDDGSPNYYVTRILNDSKWILVGDHLWPDFGLSAVGRAFSTSVPTWTNTFANGTYSPPGENNYSSGWDLFANPEFVDVSLLITGNASEVGTSIQEKAATVATSRKDCMAFLSPNYATSVSSPSADNIVAYANALTVDTSYAVMDSGWKYQFDKYNNVYRYVPLNADIAGLCVFTDSTRDPWWSPAGLNRGQIKNVVKLSWNPSKADRDVLYPAGVNPVVSFPGEGVVLFGDKTMLSKVSAFDRINVRRLFIVLEKAIAVAAKYSLFEFNDEFTRAQFIALVEPYLRDVKGRRGIFDYRVVCDTTNNTPAVIDRNEFVGDIYIKPARSINYIQLNFVAVRTGVDFTEIVGKF